MQALILAGGFGTRLRDVVSDRPKCMAPVENRPFLEYLIRMLQRQNCDEVILSTGYRAQAIRDYFSDGSRFGLKVVYSHEAEPLGTGGATKLAESKIHDDNFLVFNGDSILEIDVIQMLTRHRQISGLITLALVEVGDASRYGTVEFTPTGEVTGFAEKVSRTAPGFINGGVYACSHRLFDFISADRAVSLEREVFPALIGKGVHCVTTKSYFVDIGVPEDYARVRAQPEELKRIAGVA